MTASLSKQSHFDRAVDSRIEQYLKTIYSQAIAEFASTYFTKRSKELRQKDAELEAKIAALGKRLDERQSLAKGDFRFARDRGDAGDHPASIPAPLERERGRT